MNGVFCCLVHVRRSRPRDMSCSLSGASVSTGECWGAVRKGQDAGQPVLCAGLAARRVLLLHVCCAL